jgi:hypothetical protein
MKKILTGCFLLFIAVAGHSQALKPVKIDNLVTVSMPAINQEKDTLGQKIYSANTAYGFVTVILAPNEKNNAPLKKEKDLNKALKDYITKIQAQAGGGSALHVRDTTIGALKAKVFTLKSADNADNVQYINFTLIYTQEATYTFEYVYPEIRKDLVAGEYKAFISSIKLSPELQRNDQYLNGDTGMAPVVKIAIFGGGTLIVILIIVLVMKRKKNLAVS